MTGTARHYFARGNTAHGVHFLYHSAFQGLSKMVVLSGLPGTGKSTAIRRLADAAVNQGWNVELFHSPLNPDELDAMLIPNLKMGIADASVCEGLPSSGNIEAVQINFENALNRHLLSEDSKQQIVTLQEQLQANCLKAYESFAAALRIHDEWEKFYIEAMDFNKADELVHELADSLFGSRVVSQKAAVRHLFFGAATPRGAVDHIQNLTAGLDRRIFVKGRPGSGKSTLLKRLAAAAEARGFDVEVFHCGFDPNSLDMLIFPEISTAIFDSTAPHEYFPEKDSDEILDMYARFIVSGTDERFASELDPIKQRYTQKMKEATSYLEEARQLDAQIKEYYTAATDFTIVDNLYSELQKAVDELAAIRSKQ
jgi:KaiC/GvpD/RAD55 family RecA-like ATPase